MPIQQTQISEEKHLEEPLIQITLPAPPDMNPSAPLSIGQHNACAQKYFKKVAEIISVVINNQKLMGLAITRQAEQIKKIQEDMNKTAENIRILLKEDDKNE